MARLNKRRRAFDQSGALRLSPRWRTERDKSLAIEAKTTSNAASAIAAGLADFEGADITDAESLAAAATKAVKAVLKAHGECMGSGTVERGDRVEGENLVNLVEAGGVAAKVSRTNAQAVYTLADEMKKSLHRNQSMQNESVGNPSNHDVAGGASKLGGKEDYNPTGAWPMHR